VAELQGKLDKMRASGSCCCCWPCPGTNVACTLHSNEQRASRTPPQPPGLWLYNRRVVGILNDQVPSSGVAPSGPRLHVTKAT
jgi:hypothetical protein